MAEVHDKCHIEVQCPLTLYGCITQECVLDHDCPPNNIIKSTDHFHVLVSWWVDGTVTTLLGGEFNVRACFESIGPGIEDSFPKPPLVIPVSNGTPDPSPANPLRKHYKADVFVPAGSLDSPGQASTAYKLITVVTYTNNGQPGNIAGYSDEMVVQIYDPNPKQP